MASGGMGALRVTGRAGGEELNCWSEEIEEVLLEHYDLRKIDDDQLGLEHRGDFLHKSYYWRLSRII